MAKEKQLAAYVYMVECEDGSIYTGIARNVEKRIEEHRQKKPQAAKYTKSHPVKKILMVWEASSYSSAARMEYAIKQLSHRKKTELIARPQAAVEEFFPKLDGEIYLPQRHYCLQVSEPETVDKTK
jgi:putative endonuclease